MITPYYGGLTVLPIPLELSFGPCGYGCAYCFVRLNGSRIEHSHASLVNQLKRAPERKTLAAILIDDGYPILVSNRSDPFSNTVWHLARPAIELLTQMGKRVYFQTKGATEAQLSEMLSILDYKAEWYITVTTLDDKLAKALEPGAPAPSKRLKMIERLTASGHSVKVGINPNVAEWQGPDTEGFLKRLAEAGANGLFIQNIHINSNQLRKMTSREKSLFSEAVLKEAMASAISIEKADRRREMASIAEGMGLSPYIGHSTKGNAYFAESRRFYPKTFPIMADALARLAETSGKGRFFNFESFWEALTSVAAFPQGKFKMRDYVASSNKSILYNQAIDLSAIDFKSLMRLVWQEDRLKISPARNRHMAKIVDPDDDALIVDEDDDLPIYAYVRDTLMNEYEYYDDVEALIA